MNTNLRDFDVYVSSEQAKLLKKHGFDIKCNHYYDDEEFLPHRDGYMGEYDNEYINADKIYHSINSLGDDPELDDCYDAPTLEQARRWLRKEKGYDIEIISCRNRFHDYRIVIQHIDSNLAKYIETYPDYDVALSYAISDILKEMERKTNEKM